MNSNDLNSILSNLELTAIHIPSEVKVAALLGRTSLMKLDQAAFTETPGLYLFINDVCPESFFICEKEKGEMTARRTSFLYMQKVKVFIKYRMPELMSQEEQRDVDHLSYCCSFRGFKPCSNESLYMEAICAPCLKDQDPQKYSSIYAEHIES